MLLPSDCELERSSASGAGGSEAALDSSSIVEGLSTIGIVRW